MSYGRPSDWSVLRGFMWPSDPIPGDPQVVSDCAIAYQKTADAIQSIGGDLKKRIVAESKGASIDQILDDIECVANEMIKAKGRIQGAANALSPYAGALETAQRESLEAYNAAEAAKGESDRFARAATEAKSDYNRVSGRMSSIDREYRRSIDPDKREELQAQYNALRPYAQQYEQQYNSAASKKDSADSSLQAARAKLQRAIQDRDEAANKAILTLERASDESELKDSWWDKVCQWASDVFEAVNSLVTTVLSKIIDFLKSDFAAMLLRVAVGVVAAALSVTPLAPVGHLILAALLVGDVIETLRSGLRALQTVVAAFNGTATWAEAGAALSLFVVDASFTMLNVLTHDASEGLGGHLALEVGKWAAKGVAKGVRAGFFEWVSNGFGQTGGSNAYQCTGGGAGW